MGLGSHRSQGTTCLDRATKRLWVIAFLGGALQVCGLAQQAATVPPDADSATTVLPPAPPPESSLQAARLSDVEGAVQLTDAGGQSIDPARMNMPVLPGMQIKTGSDGRAEVQFPDGSVARVTPNSSLRLASVPVNQQPSSAESTVTLTATAGLTYFESVDAQSLTVQVGPEKVTPAAGSLIRVGLDTEPAQVAVIRGSAHFATAATDALSDVHFDLPMGQTASIDLHSATDYDVATSVSSDSWDAWNTDRDAVLASLAADQTSARGDSMTGQDLNWNDLDYYGNWYDVPGYGMAWAPDNAGGDFDPYGAGYWSYYTGVGYTWISAYPWGWLPYHCGSWNYYDGGGWMWFPSSCSTHHWLAYAPVRRVPRRYHFPERPLAVNGRREPLVPVNRAPIPVFRVAGQPKPAPRFLALRDDKLQPVIATPYPVYSAFAGGGYRTTYNGLGHSTGVVSGVARPLFSGRTTLPSTVSVPGPLPHYMPPVYRAPAAPAPAPHFEAPRATAPAPAAAGHAH